ncbi:uncharacterized protein V6R79_009384 [Siganus canaliculatus]
MRGFNARTNTHRDSSARRQLPQCVSSRLAAGLSLAQHVHDNQALGAVIKEALDLRPPCRHGRQCVVTSQEAGGGMERRLLLLQILGRICKQRTEDHESVETTSPLRD